MDETILQRCIRVICRVREDVLMLAAAYWGELADAESIETADVQECEELLDAGNAVCSALCQAAMQAREDGTAPGEMPCPFGSLEAMNGNDLQKWVIAKIETKAGKQFFYE